MFKLSLLDVLEYRTDFVLSTFKYTMMILFMALVWLSVGRQTDNLPMTSAQMISYFFWAAVLYSLSNFHTYYIDDDIRLGYLSRFLLKPISPFWYYFTVECAKSLLGVILRMVAIIPLIWFFGLSLNMNMTQLGILAIYMSVIFTYSFHQFALISGLSFWINESWAIRWALTVVFRFFAGILVPISFFPEWGQRLSFIFPFQHLAYTPIMYVQHQFSLTTALQGLLVLASWLLILILLRTWQWNAGYREYEGTGI